MKTRKRRMLGVFLATLIGVVLIHAPLAETVSLQRMNQNLSRGMDPFPESRFGVAPHRERISKNYQDNKGWQEVEPGRGLASVNPGDGFSTRAVNEMELVEDRAPVTGGLATAKERAYPQSTRGVQEFSIITTDLGYFPKHIFVNPNIPVRLYVTGSSKRALCIMMDSFQIRRQVRSEQVEELEFTPNTPGKFRYYCPVNGIEGALIVREMVDE